MRIAVAESSEKGGTWSGVVDGLRKRKKNFCSKARAKWGKKCNLSVWIHKGAVAE